MIRAVLDSNVVVSASLRNTGLPAAIVDLAIERKIQMYVSDAVLGEYKEVLNRSRLALPPRPIAPFLATIRRISILEEPMRTITLIPDHPDNRLLECAQAASAHYLITGNVRHFPERFQATEIVTPLEFISLVYPALAQIRRESR